MLKTKRFIFTIIILFAAIFFFYAGINLYARCLSANRLYSLEDDLDALKAPDAILVLGAGVWSNGTPSNMLQDRLLTALDLYERGVCDVIIVSGDHGTTTYDEVNVMKSYLIRRGVPSDCIYMDHAGFSTYDSIYRAKAIFGVKSVLIITQEYHAFRSNMIAKHLGVESFVVTAPILSSDVDMYPKQMWYSF